MDYVLGLDLGTTSIGWAVAELGEDGRPQRLVDANSRIFLSMVDAEKKEPKNKNRRVKRGMRKLTRRYKQRRTELIGLLLSHGFLSPDQLNPENWESNLNQLGNPFRLRAHALEDKAKLELAELARVFLHLLKRRGYKSNRGAKFAPLLAALRERGVALKFDEQDASQASDEDSTSVKQAKEEAGTVLSGLRLLEHAMREKKCDTVAQLVVKLADEETEGMYAAPMRPHSITRSEQTKKGKEVQYHLYVSREQNIHEFNLIWDAQSKHYRELMTSELKILIHHAIFFQRPLQSQRGRVGKCSLEIQKSRAAKALLDAQEFLVLDDLNVLAYSLPKQEGEVWLSKEQQRAILAKLADCQAMKGRGSLSWADVKTAAELPPKAKFNMERTSKSGLRGNRTHLAMSRAIPAKWLALGQSREFGETFSGLQQALVGDLVNIENKVALFNRLTNHYGLPESRNPWRFLVDEAFALVTLDLEEGYIKHCSHVVTKLLPAMRGGAMYPDAVQAARYLRRDQKVNAGLPKLAPAPEIANPVVQKALFETRRVVNAAIEKYGKPTIVRLEMARDMKASKKHREEMDKRNKENQKANTDAAEEIRAYSKKYPHLGIRVTRDSIIKYKLWQEQREVCAYSYGEANADKTISPSMLFDSSATEIDHIYPLSISLDDSQLNKVLCMRRENMEKGQQTPWQRWHGTPKYDGILRRFDRTSLPNYPAAKLKRLKDDKFDASADFAAAQLNDTRYICVAVRNYLATLGLDDQHLQVSRGQMTAELRKLWGLAKVLPKTDAPPNDAAGIDSETGEIVESPDDKKTIKEKKKKDRGDHRHHAIDAIVTALVDGQVFKDLMNRYRSKEEQGTWPDLPLKCPIPDLRHAAEKIVMGNVVSHAPRRKISGGLHEELPYGLGV